MRRRVCVRARMRFECSNYPAAKGVSRVLHAMLYLFQPAGVVKLCQAAIGGNASNLVLRRHQSRRIASLFLFGRRANPSVLTQRTRNWKETHANVRRDEPNHHAFVPNQELRATTTVRVYSPHRELCRTGNFAATQRCPRTCVQRADTRWISSGTLLISVFLGKPIPSVFLSTCARRAAFNSRQATSLEAVVGEGSSELRQR